MAEMSREDLGREEIRRIASEYLHEVAQYCAELQSDTPLVTSVTVRGLRGDRLQEKAGELLSAMARFTDLGERRKAVLKVLCGVGKRHPSDLPR